MTLHLKYIYSYEWGRHQWKLLQDISYKQWTVPKGYISDLASVPSILWPIFPPYGRYLRASVFHDYLYEHNLTSKKEADILFLEIMTEDDVPFIIRFLFYYAVRFKNIIKRRS